MQIVRKSAQANEDLFEIWHYIAVENQSPENAERFIDGIDDTLQFLSKNPTVGTLKDFYVKGIRQFIFQKYLIFYFQIENGIEVIRVLHGARDITQLF